MLLCSFGIYAAVSYKILHMKLTKHFEVYINATYIAYITTYDTCSSHIL